MNTKYKGMNRINGDGTFVTGEMLYEKEKKLLQQMARENPLVSEEQTIVVLGGAGQVGSFLVPELERLYPGRIRLFDKPGGRLNEEEMKQQGILPFDIVEEGAVDTVIREHNPGMIINLVALLSGASERNPELAHKINYEGVVKVLEAAKEYGVGKVFTPSSIAVLENVGQRGELDSPLIAEGKYGKSKQHLEEKTARFAQNDLDARCLRFGGVFTCKYPPSDGTTEELDKMIVAAAAFKAGVDPKFDNFDFTEGKYYVQVPMGARFPMVDGRSIAQAVMKFLHTPKERLGNHPASHFIAEAIATPASVAEILKDLAPGLQVVYDESRIIPGNEIKKRFSEIWPQEVDMKSAGLDWEHEQTFTLPEMVKYGFDTNHALFSGRQPQVVER
ncbi:MAG: NAD-dependent epimerase/dehydratase family protein [Hyphomicrobiales bacterium]|nr:NAD-dependent epimerase/dehydratase family protein [Hyphomicrobiales bacterium]